MRGPQHPRTRPEGRGYIEHATSPLELGYLTSVEADDGELFGTVALSAEANDLTEGTCELARPPDRILLHAGEK
ncbi:MAG: hypothetical protein IH944_01180 [Armatimonadetes bacterium]|nr:hypothetical protein [Armatimonadota bacterium]